jgi:hypothetical protein
MNYPETPSKGFNQRQLKELLNLSANEIRSLKENGTLRYQRIGTQDIFDETSVNLFMESFNRDDYLTVGECRKILVHHEYYTDRDRVIYISRLGIYITVKSLTEGNPEIPLEYRLQKRDFGKTRYITKESFNRTLDWLHEINEKVNKRRELPGKTIKTLDEIRKRKKTKRYLQTKRKIKTRDIPDSSYIESPVKPKSQNQLLNEKLVEMVRSSGLVKRNTSVIPSMVCPLSPLTQ